MANTHKFLILNTETTVFQSKESEVSPAASAFSMLILSLNNKNPVKITAAIEHAQKIELGLHRNKRPAINEATIPATEPPTRECAYSNLLAKLARWTYCSITETPPFKMKLKKIPVTIATSAALMCINGRNAHWKNGPMKIATTEIVKIKVFRNNSLSETTPKIGWKINEIPAIIENTAPDSVPFKWPTCSIQRVK